MLSAVLRRFYQPAELSSIDIFHHQSIRLKVKLRGETDELFLYSPTASPWPGIEIRNHILGSTLSDQSVDWALKQINDCIANHECCKLSNGDDARVEGLDLGLRRLPKRLLDVGDIPPGFRGGTVKLYESHSNDQDMYACLSHCWGQSHTLETTTANLQDHINGLSLDSLPLTFRDAAIFTRCLSIRYLWIDSL